MWYCGINRDMTDITLCYIYHVGESHVEEHPGSHSEDPLLPPFSMSNSYTNVQAYKCYSG